MGAEYNTPEPESCIMWLVRAATLARVAHPYGPAGEFCFAVQTCRVLVQVLVLVRKVRIRRALRDDLLYCLYIFVFITSIRTASKVNAIKSGDVTAHHYCNEFAA